MTRAHRAFTKDHDPRRRDADGDPERDDTGTDLLIEVRDPADSLLLSVDSSITDSLTNPAAEGADFVAPSAGTYYLKVRHFSALGAGNYDLLIAPDAPLAPPVAAYKDAVLADTPAGYWRFGEPSGTVLTDSSPNLNNGTYLGGVALGTAAH
jgi:hypothetical protein